ncbi:GIN domain-containing protein [Hyphomonas pacifica]|uniref:Putative auto-transporter adhesin head GIN domain-containing protein n=1 Tax=Hyphomonas pacifica TaxID=1280941 RepID=A0A062U092_9PROT|nr:DUF2807 domain-containing protein [Hyphomonas pacifica]KCZ51677.1 hypothetical protein HY2_01615 [Hyphomonas pacifica]RAN32430.1 hypothetical protein HY11_05000 [Hyphomonas pacifica]RAN34346.1 hypothetical protein HY3_01700 [Hyphomonas pacifica]
MKRTAISIAALTLAAMPALAETKSYDVSDFDALDVSGAIMVEYTQGPAHSVTVDQKDGDFSDILIETKGDELQIKRKSLEKAKWRKNMSIKHKNGELVVKVNGDVKPSYKVIVTSPSISELDISQSSMLTANNISADELELDSSSSASLTVSGTSKDTSIEASSSSDLDAEDLVSDKLSIDASSSADVSANASGAGPVDVEASSSSDVEVTIAGSSDVEIDASSSADVTVEGSCNLIDVEASSSADVDADDLICVSAKVEASSSADVGVHASKSVKATANSGADVLVHGDPAERDVSKSSGGDVDFN